MSMPNKIPGLSATARKRIGAIEKVITDHYIVEQDSLYKHIRSREVSLARFMVYFLLNKNLGLSSIRLSHIYGYHHTSVLYGIERIRDKHPAKTVDMLWTKCEKALLSCG